ncbi:hypothetical protein A9G45_06385 [Gilliamella sp. HK2]|uniref:hypothetical protein n=1 Tax=unclassified Gilliamella TaxID=2685620 RepID=UPI00080E3C20|nr:hypothetical protein [Gilliamella apicola]OCG27622.1 hypothetical protein A9G46_03065 [Gilliamella apicola]OCG28565.1 hypothetical protein A9G45_06385 [Gilliamella apicola]
MSWYKTGTINVTNGSNAVTGYNTKWTNPLIGVCSGQMLILQTQNTIEIHEIASIQSDTQLTLAKTYSGTSKTGITYEIPTSPKVSIEALALRVSEMLNYYQIQLDAWQTILTGDGDVTLTAPNGQVVTIRSQLSISNELVKLVEQSQSFAQSARESATTATNASTSASNSENTASSHAESARLSATASANSAAQSRNSVVLAQQSENNAKQSEQNAAKSADDARQHASSIDPEQFIQKRELNTMIGNPGFEIMPSGLIRQWGVVQLPAVGDYNSVVIDSIKYYTNYYRILLPIAFPHHSDSVNVTFTCGTFSNQYTMFGISATANLDGSPTSFTVAILSSVLGYMPTIHYEIIGH